MSGIVRLSKAVSVQQRSDAPRKDEITGEAAQLYVAMKASAHSTRKKSNIDNVWRALKHLTEVKSADFSIASVARAVEALGLGGPKAQSIRNAEGKDFRDLVRAYVEEFGEPARGKSESSEDERIVGSITDLRTASLVRELLNDKRSQDRRIDLLKNFIGKLAPVDVGSEQRVTSTPKAMESDGEPKWNSTEIAAVVSFMRNVRDSGEDLNLRFEQASGALLWKNGILEVARPGFLGILKKIAGENS